MPAIVKQVRIFIASTLGDMQAERNYLVTTCSANCEDGV